MLLYPIQNAKRSCDGSAWSQIAYVGAGISVMIIERHEEELSSWASLKNVFYQTSAGR